MEWMTSRNVLMVALHGVAVSPAEVERIIASLESGFPLKRARWIFPRAPWRPITLLGGRTALAWYDVLARDPSRIDEAGLEQATRRLTELIGAERRNGSSRSPIVLAGFSQGGALALHAGIRLGDAVAGTVAVSSALPCPDGLPPSRPESPPIFIAHGLFDTVVPFSMGRASMRALVAKGYRVDWHTYPAGHWINGRCLRHVAGWLERAVLETPVRARAATRRPRFPRLRLATRSGFPA
jgi:phospholipase/carboxylesterase